MEYICCDTCVWIDFAVIGHIELPFLLPHTYIMSVDAINDELLSPKGLNNELLRHGLVGVDYTDEELDLTTEFVSRYPRLTTHDCVALAIAKNRNIVLLTGDRDLRKAAKSENVKIMGTLGILDRLLQNNHITEHDYICYLNKLQEHNGKKVRLPKSELIARLQRIKKESGETVADDSLVQEATPWYLL